MKRLWVVLTNPFWLSAVLVLIIYTVASRLLPPKLVIEFVRIVLFGLNGAVVIAFFRPACGVMFRAEPTDSDKLVVGIWLAWTAQWLIALLALLWRVSGQPAWLLNNDLIGLALTLFAYAAVAHLAGAIDGTPRRRVVVLGLVVSFSVMSVFAIAAFSSSLNRFVALIRPYLDEGAPSEYGRPVPQNQRVLPLYPYDGGDLPPQINIRAPGL